MKTTIELSDAVLREARQVAARERMSLRALIEEGLWHVLAERRRRPTFRLRRVTFAGEGLAPEVAGESWPAFRDRIHPDAARDRDRC
jgi:hypothetical protein